MTLNVNTKWNRFVRGFRIASTRAVAVVFLAVAMVTDHRWIEDGWMDTLMELFGFILVLVCTLGRVWCSIYLAGYKQKVLVTQGPYSLSRNPLYLFSSAGALGVAFATETLTLPLAVALSFAVYYRYVIINEEKRIRELFGEKHVEYAARVPAFFPRLDRLLTPDEPEQYMVNPRLVRKELKSVGWFITAFLAVHSFERLHELGILPVLIKLF